jgi:antitoxin ParD1/3/4
MVPIGLSPELEEFVDREVASGRYLSREELIADAVLQLHQEREFEDDLRRKIQVGIDELDRGDVIRIRSDEDARDFFEDIKRRGRDRLNASRGEQ